MSDRLALYAGARLLEGGADNDEVYSFGTFAYAVGAVRIGWGRPPVSVRQIGRGRRDAQENEG